MAAPRGASTSRSVPSRRRWLVSRVVPGAWSSPSQRPPGRRCRCHGSHRQDTRTIRASYFCSNTRRSCLSQPHELPFKFGIHYSFKGREEILCARFGFWLWSLQPPRLSSLAWPEGHLKFSHLCLYLQSTEGSKYSLLRIPRQIS